MRTRRILNAATPIEVSFKTVKLSETQCLLKMQHLMSGLPFGGGVSVKNKNDFKFPTSLNSNGASTS